MRDTADEVDQRDDDARDGVALDELERAVEGAVELALARRAAARRSRACSGRSVPAR